MIPLEAENVSAHGHLWLTKFSRPCVGGPRHCVRCACGWMTRWAQSPDEADGEHEAHRLSSLRPALRERLEVAAAARVESAAVRRREEMAASRIESYKTT